MFSNVFLPLLSIFPQSIERPLEDVAVPKGERQTVRTKKRREKTRVKKVGNTRGGCVKAMLVSYKRHISYTASS